MDGRYSLSRARKGTRLALLLVVALSPLGCGHRPAALSGAARGEEAAPDSSEDAYRGSVAALMWPGATRAWQVSAAGDLFDGAQFVRVEPASDGVTAAPPERIWSENRWCPVLHWIRESGCMRWEFEAVAFPEPEPAPWSARGAFARQAAARAREADARSEAASYAGIEPERLARLMLRAPHPLERNAVDRRNLFVSWRVTATNRGTEAADARLRLRCEPPGDDPPYRDPDTLVRVPWEHCWWAGSAADSVMGLAPGEIHDRALVRAWRLEPGERAMMDVVFSAYSAPGAQLQQLARVPHEQRVAESREYWLRETGRGATFDIPDPSLRNALRAARVVLLSLRERRDVDWVPLGGPFHYRDVWLRDGARMAAALAVTGYTRESRELARSSLRFVTPSGAFVSQSGQLDGTGQALWAMEQTLLRPSPAPDVPRFAAAALRGWRAVELQRGLARGALAGRAAGMLPETDPHDGELVRAQLVGNDAWSLAGYRATARLLRASGENDSAGAVERSRAEYLAAFRQALDATGRPDVPPSWQGIGIDWGNLNAGYPCEVLEHGDARLAALARRYWAPVGGPGLGYYRDPDSLHTYVAADLGTVALLSGDREAAQKILDAMLYWRTASGGAAEMFSSSRRDFGRNFPPHPTSAAALLMLVRNSLMFDDGDTLQLTLGARAAWWSGARVRGAPTRWGAIDLEFSRVGGVATWRWTSVPVWTALTLPPGTVAPRELPAPLRHGARADVVLAPPGTSEARVEVVQVAGGAGVASSAGAARGATGVARRSNPRGRGAR